MLVQKFNSYYASRPVLTTMVTSSMLHGIADTVAQTLTAYRQRAVRSGHAKDDGLAVELRQLDRKNPLSDTLLIPDSRLLPPPFSYERLARFMAYGFLMAPLQHRWFSFLTRTIPLAKGSEFASALKRVLLDQAVFAPAGLAAFFSFMTLTEGGGKRALANKFRDVYVPALKANYTLWPMVQIINFRVVPLPFQIPLVSTVGIGWTAYLSLANSAQEVKK